MFKMNTNTEQTAKLEQPSDFWATSVPAHAKPTDRVQLPSPRDDQRESWQAALLAGIDGNDALIGTQSEASET